ncbi:MAG: SprT family zinc-dependent metalloprotease [Synechococcales cyanobacterium]
MQLPSYTVHISPRTRRVRLKVSLDRGLQVIIPKGFPLAEVPQILHQSQRWWTKTLATLQERQQVVGRQSLAESGIPLRAIDHHWSVSFQPTSSPELHLRETPNLTLVLMGPVNDEQTVQRGVRQWLIQQGRGYLLPWLQRVSQETQLPYQRGLVKTQKTRWGSCSTAHTISLNAKLLFLPPELVRSVLIHELCHTVHLNHSPAFWRCVAQYDPLYQQWRQELKQSWRYVPHWVDHSGIP